MDWFCLCSLFLFGIVTNAIAEPYYAIIAPKIVRPDSEYHVTVSTIGVSTPSNVYIELSGNLNNGDHFNVSQTVVVEPYSTRIVRLEIGDTSPGHYTLFARGLTGIQFANSTEIQYVHKSYSVFIQTDRAIYKPGNKVMFRCLILDSRLRPSLTRQVDIHIIDGANNRIKQWQRPQITRGVFTGELELSMSPVLGTWKIVVNVNDQMFDKEFEVAEYVLPKFEVTIDAPKHSTFKESKVTATVRAKYTYGKPVKGEATITAFPNIFSGVIQPIFQQPVRKIVPIDGKATVDFNIITELRLTDENERPIRIEATVEEELTGRRQNVSVEITLHKHKYTMELIKTSEYYKPGLKYTAFIKLAYHDGAPVQDTKNPVLIAYGYTYNQSAFSNVTRFLDKNGMIQLDFYPPIAKDDISVPLNIEAQYLNLHEWFSSTNQAMSRSNQYIQAILKTENPTVNHDVEIEVNSTTPLKYLSYEVLGRGDILDAGWIPCYHEASGAWYYYQASTSTTTWEHPLDSVYRELVDQVRSGNRQMSVEEDSKTTAKDLESHEEASLPKEPSVSRENTSSTLRTKIPTKLAPLKKIDRSQQDVRKKEDRIRSRRESDTKSDMISSLSTDRAARDYTNLKFQDPNFYECPKLLDNNVTVVSGSTETTTPITTPKKELDLKEVLKRSESLSPRHEKDWEQLSSKFSSEENIIDIDKLSASALARSDKTDLKFDKEKHPSQLGQQKELTLSGGGSMFLKSNRSRDTTPSQDSAKLEDFRVGLGADVVVLPDALKSILREKQSEDDERPLDEERKSVRFDLEKEVDIKFTYSGSEDEWDSGSEEHNPPISNTTIVDRQSDTTTSVWKATPNRSFDDDDDKVEVDDVNIKKSTLITKLQPLPKSSKIVGKRFVVRNVSEIEHRTQMNANDTITTTATTTSVIKTDNDNECTTTTTTNLPEMTKSKFENIKNIDLISKGETESSITKNTDSISVPDKTWKTTVRLHNIGTNGNLDLARIVKKFESSNRNTGKSKLEHSRSLEDTKINLTEEHEVDTETLKKEFEEKLELARKEFEDNLRIEKETLRRDFEEKLIEFKRELAEKEEQEIQKLIAGMDESRAENLKKVREELEVCYEKERLEILTSLKSELNERKRELLELRNQEMEKLETEHERDLGEEKLAKLNEFELNKQQTERIEALKKELDKEFDEVKTELRMQQREKITKLTEEHDKCLAEILRDFRIDEGLARKMYKQRLEEIRADFSRDLEKEARKQTERALQQECMDFEKIRCEKRLLQDKYIALKEKYIKLKNDVRLTVERRNKSRGGGGGGGYTTTSETERSKTERTDSSDQNTPLRSTHSTNSMANAKPTDIIRTTTTTAAVAAATTGTTGIGTNTTATTAGTNVKSQSLNESEDSKSAANRSSSSQGGFRGIVQTNSVPSTKNAAKFESDDTTTASETNANTMRRRKSLGRKMTSNNKQQLNVNPNTVITGGGNNNNNNNIENPVENIRKQLEKLEHLGDQLPSNETAYTLRYPFQDKAPANASSELEFFRHRIHVERDSVRRAREAWKQQRNAFQGRQRALKQRSARATLEQLVQEERELSDMEVSLHRTRSLLGEKVIHLRHLEQSLERVANAKRNENDATSTKNDELTLSDMSSASSGFSSTDIATDTFIDKPDHYQESTEIIANLENLNSEIREIWNVLNKRQDSNNIPPPTLMYSYLRWLRLHPLTASTSNIQGTFGTPNIQSNILSQLTAAQPPPTTTTQNIIAQYGPNSGFTTSVGNTVEKSSSNLADRTRNLRDWLRQARVETTDMIGPGQATL